MQFTLPSGANSFRMSESVTPSPNPPMYSLVIPRDEEDADGASSSFPAPAIIAGAGACDAFPVISREEMVKFGTTASYVRILICRASR